jgi:hypothetical protein
MSPEEVAVNVERIVKKAQERVGPNSIGAKQYYVPGVPQKFESMSLGDLVQYVEEEVLDLVNYSCMLYIRLERIKELMVKVEVEKHKLKHGDRIVES